jgi:ribose 5-phosphate isomerase B
MKIAIGCDHRGLLLKAKVAQILQETGHTFKDFGAFTEDSVDYPDIAQLAAEAVARGEYDRAILICGTGIGMCIAANKVNGIRAAQVYNTFTAHRCRQHNNANVICIAAEEEHPKLKPMVVDFLETEFEGGRHINRVNKIKAIEEKQCK